MSEKYSEIFDPLTLALNNEIDLKYVFTGILDIANTNQTAHKFEESQREGVLCCLYNIVNEMDLRMSFDNVKTFIAIYGNNLRTLINKPLLMSKKAGFHINKNECKLVSYLVEDIISHNLNKFIMVISKRKQLEHLRAMFVNIDVSKFSKQLAVNLC